ncbi:hypothetical protein EJ02DRAFT_439596 [Clathrospora elynae]|uniref:Uncharacterized protein n=1 Tax=Clathrospora elynae TaxID=706981 RepID=A0A6A5S8X8_9PLEO|nr:hypothetical protein EJ02DRAFT_439596 [Clathrospora elynae]
MDERESSVVSSVDFYESEATPVTATDAQNNAPLAKRKAEDAPAEQPKKRKLVASFPCTPSHLRRCARLPPELWQHVFSFCSLGDLGRLIQVNRSFLSYLTDVRSVSTSKSHPGRLHLLKSESLWASARNALSIKPPKPLPGFTELQMWQLAWSKRCQFCNKLNSFTPGERIWQKGPGDEGVRVIWPFAIRACGSCLLQQCQTDSSLLVSAASALRPALPFALLTNDQHYVTTSTLQSSTIPAAVEIAKFYLKKHVEEITQDLDEALSHGPAAAEEWLKGLEARGKKRMRVAENWERWEVKYQSMEEHNDARRTASTTSSLAATPHKEPFKSPPRRTPSPVIHAPVPATPLSQHPQARPPTAPPQPFTPSGQRNLHDANEAKANRKTDIERRCQEMKPPIAPNILRHMDSFKAAIQISQPMNDYAWSMLQPRLLAQLAAAQQAEADHVSRAALLPTRTADRRHPEANSKETREVMDREWEESQRPIRDRLEAIADDFINQDWDHGNAVTYENSPKFAADLLAYVRRTFYAEREEQNKGASSNTADTRPKLVLDNMKWVYDNKIKTLTEQFRKDIFLCHGNGCEHNNKFYGFEGVTQHYGAKHTAAFSLGNVVVAWREAEWPEETPFHPDPISVKHAQQAHHASASTTGFGGYFGGYSRAGTSTPHMQPHLPQASPRPYNYGVQYNGPFPPPQGPPGTIPGFEYPQPYATPVDTYAHQAMGPPGYGPQLAHAFMTSPAMLNTAVGPPPTMPPPGQGFPETVPNGTEDAGHSTSSFDKQVSTVIDMTQDIWKRTSGIKDMPNSLRIYVLLHRVISKFHVEFNHEPNLDHFIDALSNHEMPKPLKNAPGLSCKACQIGSSHQLAGVYYSRSEERRTYTGLSLLSHFKAQHMPFQQSVPSHGLSAAPLDWKEDMIELPSERFISGLIHAPGMDDEKLLMIATVFPSLFPMPLPKIGVIDSHGLASPASSCPKDVKETLGPVHTSTDAAGDAGSSSLVVAQPGSSLPPKLLENEHGRHQPTLASEMNEASTSVNRKRSYRDSSPTERRQHHYAEPRYYMPREHLDDGYSRPREYVEYAPSPRIIHSGLAYEEYSGRRTAFREQERLHGPPPEDVGYAHPREGSRGSREYSAYPRQVRYYEEDGPRPEYRYVNERRSREASPRRGKSAADRFLEEFLPGQASANERPQSQLPPQSETKPIAPAQEAEDGMRYTPPPPDASVTAEPGPHIRPLAPPLPRAPSTVSNGSRFEGHHPRHMPTPDSGGPSRRSGPQRQRDRPREQRVPARYQRYMSVARDDQYGRGSSMSRSQSKRYEDQRRRIDQQETPQPNAEPDYEPTYSREASFDQPIPEDGFYQPARRPPRGYVSVQDRLQHYSPPRFRYDEPRGPQPVYMDEYGYEVIRVPRQPRGPYMAHQPPRHEQDHYHQYMPVSYERPPQQRYNGRPEEYMYYEEKERPLPRRPVPDAESDVYEPPPPDIKVESAPMPMPE